MIRIRSKRDGFRRCGLAHSTQWQLYSDDFFTDEQLERLFAEPMLDIEVIEDTPTQAMEAEAKLELGAADAESIIDPSTDQQPAAGRENSVIEQKKPSRAKKQD